MRTYLLAVMATVAVSNHTMAAPRTPDLFSEGMVLQREQPVPIWGTAEPGETVTVSIVGKEASGVTDKDGKWMVTLPALPTCIEPTDLVIKGRTTEGVATESRIPNVLIGEVWLCSGQSNMGYPVNGCSNAAAEQAAAHYPMIRMFTVTERADPTPQSSCVGRWSVCTPDSVGLFSGTGYFFARKIHTDLGIPVGMIHASVGGTAINSWTPLETLKATDAGKAAARAFEHDRDIYLSDTNKFAQIIEAGKAKRETELADYDRKVFATDVGHVEGWAAGVLGSGEWKPADMPLPYRATGNFCGSAWCRKSLTIPTNWLGQNLRFNFGSIDEADEIYINGTLIGETHDNSLWQTPRHYSIPAAIVTNSELIIVVRVMNQVGAMGVGGIPADFSLQLAADNDGASAIQMAKDWTYAMGSPLSFNNRPIPDTTSVPGIGINPSTLYNAMIHPLAPYAIRGALWYQGEADAGYWKAYTELLPAMVKAWRDEWHQQEFPFLIVQLANFFERCPNAIEVNSYAEIRDVQRKMLGLIPNSGLAVILDTGDGEGHPKDKQDVGFRLGLWALSKIYGHNDIVPCGPLYKDMTVDSNKVVLSFDDFGSGLIAREEPMTGFAIAGNDKIFYKAQAEIQGDHVVVWSDRVATPVAVRYAWMTNPKVSLYNKAGLPASSFRTDDWDDARAGD